MDQKSKTMLGLMAILLVIAFSVHSFSKIQPQTAATVRTNASKDSADLVDLTKNPRIRLATKDVNLPQRVQVSPKSTKLKLPPKIPAATSSTGYVYVLDQIASIVQKFDTNGNFILQWGAPWTGGNAVEGKFYAPLGVAVESYGDYVYVSDQGHNRIQKFDSNGNFILAFGWGVQTGASQLEVCTLSCATGIYGSGDGQMASPDGIVVDSAKNIYVVDGFNNRVQKFDSSGNFLFMFGWGVATGANQFEICTSACQIGIQALTGNGQFQTPVSIAISKPNPAPDLIVDSITPTPVSYQTNQINGPFSLGVPPYPVQININIKNIGNADAVLPVGTKLLYQMVADNGTNIAANHGPTCPGCPAPLPYIATSVPITIPPGTTYTFDTDTQFMWASPMTLGNYKFSTWIDWPQGASNLNGLVEESDESNNTKSFPFVVVP